MEKPSESNEETHENKSKENPLRILLIDESAESYRRMKEMLESLGDQFRFSFDHADNYEQGLEYLNRHAHDIYFLDFKLGVRTGLELLSAAMEIGCEVPIIFLADEDDYDADVAAMRAGAFGYLVKDEITPRILERTVRYNVARMHSEVEMRTSREQARRLSKELIKAQEDERRRIAQELHDSVGQMLAAVKFSAENLFHELDEATRERLATAQTNFVKMVQETVEEVREISTRLRPPALESGSIERAIHWFCNGFGITYTRMTVKAHVSLCNVNLPDDLQIIIFRIMQEAMNNAAKHSEATVVEVELSGDGEGLILTVEDNGKGFDVQPLDEDVIKADSCMGLKGMIKRAELFGGTLEVVSSPGNGTLIRALWPLDCSCQISEAAD